VIIYAAIVIGVFLIVWWLGGDIEPKKRQDKPVHIVVYARHKHERKG
jgi:hypothetical protein